VVSVIAGPGYGKTTSLAAMAERDPRPVAWLSLDARDDDPAVLLSDLALVLDQIHPLDHAVLQRLTSSGSRVSAMRIRELTRAMGGFTESVLLVLDDLHLLKSPSALDIISSLIDHDPAGWTIALASRTVPDLSLPRLRASGRLLELGDRDLAMDRDETAALVRGAGLDLPDEAISLIERRTEGWPVAIYLATLSIRDEEDRSAAVDRFGGDELVIAEYVRDELLRSLPKRQLRFLTRTAILHELTPALCDEVMGSEGSASMLAKIARSNPLVVPLSGHGERYRYHRLFRDVLLAELGRVEPAMVPDLYGRAAAWSEAEGLLEDAIDYAQAGGHTLDAARLVCSSFRPYLARGRFQTLGSWLAWFDEKSIRAYPPLATVAVWYQMFTGEGDPVYWLRIAEAASFDGPMPDGGGSFEASVALVRAALCLSGPEEMEADLALASELGAPSSEYRVIHHLLAGEAALLRGQTDRAREIFTLTAEFAGPEQTSGHVMALSELAGIAAEEGEWDDAHRLTEEARSIATSYGLGDLNLQPLMFAVPGLVLAREGEPDRARRELVEAQKLRVTTTLAMPSFSIRGRLFMARAYLALSDVDGARTVLAEARASQARRPGIGTLADALDEVESELRQMRGGGMSGPASLTVAELRVLCLLPTHLTFREIGERLFVSTNTVKTHAMSIYRKLGVSSRSQAVDRAAELGLLDL
jgi:LuxR family maltose regulon positive regulatory protein